MVVLWDSPDGPLRPRSSSAAVSAVVGPALGATKSPARAEEREAVALQARADLQALGADSFGVELLLLSLESSGSLARSVGRSTGARALFLLPTVSSPVPVTMFSSVPLAMFPSVPLFGGVVSVVMSGLLLCAGWSRGGSA